MPDEVQEGNFHGCDKSLIAIHPTAKDFHYMWKKACETASKYIAEAKEYNKQRKHPVFPVSPVKPYFQTEEDNFPSRKSNPTPPEIVELEDIPGPVNKIIKSRKLRLNGKDQKQYLVRFKNHTADKYKWLAVDAIPNGNLHMRRLRASRRTEKSHQ
ncbi:hypothetical protein O181_053271 [Austropuccinia psidii MF-1]|uniref:Uncharacterized protein n=1 Tax=Austropuccinia psidii MF-1 TaxID=1389203 RepID=A0A9Q3E045_9BASI|nr:hypothetical protein [Austropuccinia psidii MF-1]